MVGDEYLQIRAQLGTALFSLSTLAHGLHAGREVMQTLQDLRATLREPFLFLAVGDAQAGKSTLTNALFGRELISSSRPPATDKIHIYKYGTEEKTVPVYEQFVEHYRSDALLRDFNIVDTPASSTITHEHLAIVDQLLSAADLVLFVFSITDPWSSSSMDFLGHIGGKMPKNAVFVLQQCDLRESYEVEAVAKHLEQTIQEKYPGESRVFPVSAKKAYLSKTTGMDKDGLFQQSGFGPLESYINDVVANCADRKAGLRAACQSARKILASTAEKTRATFSIITRDFEKLTELNLDLEERRDQTTRHIGGVQWAMAESFERMQKRGEELLQQGKLKANSKDGKLQPPIDAEMENSICRQIQHSVELMEEDMRHAWPELQATLQKLFAGNDSEITPLTEERSQLLEKAVNDLGEKHEPGYFEQQRQALFAELTGWLQIPADAVNEKGLEALIPPLARHAITDFYHALEAASAMQGKLSGIGKSNRILAQFRTEMAYKREELLATLETHLRHAADHFYRELDAIFLPLQSFCSKQKMIYEPRITLVKQMEETLDKTAASLGIALREPAPLPV